MDTGASDGGLQSEINVTPLVDVVLVLLIIFMVIMPLAMRGYDVAIPAESTEPPPSATERPRPATLLVDADDCDVRTTLDHDGLPADCRVRVDDDPVAVADLPVRLTALYDGRAPEDRILLLSAQDDLNYEGVLRIVDVAKAAVDGLRIGLVTE